MSLDGTKKSSRDKTVVAARYELYGSRQSYFTQKMQAAMVEQTCKALLLVPNRRPPHGDNGRVEVPTSNVWAGSVQSVSPSYGTNATSFPHHA